MVYTFNDVLKYIPDLNKYVKSRIKDDYWEDIVQDTLLYLFINFNKLKILNIKGLLFNTCNFFIKKHLISNKIVICDILNYENTFHTNITPMFPLNKWNSNNIDDIMYLKLCKVSSILYEPFDMQLNHISIKEIATLLNTNENTIKTRIKRCKEFLAN